MRSTDSTLGEYTLTWQLEGDEGSGASTVEAAELWRKILDSGFLHRVFQNKTLFGDGGRISVHSANRNAYNPASGVVSVPHTWAQQQGLPPSEPHPERPDHGVYQIDLWHSLHCLYRIRNRIASHVPIDEVPRDDGHTLHCIDYIRQQLMCHADTTLQEALSNRKTANQCKDFNVIQDWVVSITYVHVEFPRVFSSQLD